MLQFSLNSKLKSKLLLLLDKKRQQLIAEKKQKQNKPSFISMWDDMSLIKKLIEGKKRKFLFFINFFYNKFFFCIFMKYFYSYKLVINSFYLINTEFFFLKSYCFIIKQIQYFSLQLLYKVIYTVINIYPIQLNLFNQQSVCTLIHSRIYNFIQKKNQLVYLFIIFLLFFFKKLCMLNNLKNLILRSSRFKRKFFLNIIWFRSYLTAWFLKYYPSILDV